METTLLDADNSILTVPGVLSPEECQALIAWTETLGYTDAPITTARGFVMAPSIRNNTRVMVDDPARAADLWQRLQSVIPARLGAWAAVGLNERFRFYRYEADQRFRWHHDGWYARSLEERSHLTLMIYLNEDFLGGDTEFDAGGSLSVRPRTGMALLFAHPVLHQGAPVRQGTKYVLRTDVMYRKERNIPF